MEGKLEKVKLSEILEAIKNFRDEQTETNYGEIEKLATSLVVKPYMPLEKKRAMASLIICDLNVKDDDPVTLSIKLIVRNTVYGLFFYIVNLENDLGEKSEDPAIYDALSEFGIIDRILDICYDDYKVLEKIVLDAMNISNIYRMAANLEKFDFRKADEFVEAIKQFKSELTDDKIKDLKSIVNGTSPEWKEFKEAVGDEIADAVMSNLPIDKMGHVVGYKEKKDEE